MSAKMSEIVHFSRVVRTAISSNAVWQIIGPGGVKLPGPPMPYPGKGVLEGTVCSGRLSWKTRREATAALDALRARADEMIGLDTATINGEFVSECVKRETPSVIRCELRNEWFAAGYRSAARRQAQPPRDESSVNRDVYDLMQRAIVAINAVARPENYALSADSAKVEAWTLVDAALQAIRMTAKDRKPPEA